jgi:hypothetical protein
MGRLINQSQLFGGAETQPELAIWVTCQPEVGHERLDASSGHGPTKFGDDRAWRAY